MKSPLFLSDLLTSHEPESRNWLKINHTTFRFMGRNIKILFGLVGILCGVSLCLGGSTNEFRIISIGPNAQGQITLTWNSRPGDTFTAWYANELSDNTVWTVAEANYPSQGYMTSWTDMGGQNRAAPPQMAVASAQPTRGLTKEEMEARRAAAEESAKAAIAYLMAQLEEAMEKAKARLAELRARRERGESVAAAEPQGGTDGKLGPDSPPNPGMRFYRISSPNWPSSTITSPSSGTVVTGPLTVTATGSDDVGPVGAVLLIDGVQVASDPKDSPYGFMFDTTRLVMDHTKSSC